MGKIKTPKQHAKDMAWIRDTSHICENSKKAQSMFMRFYAKKGDKRYLEAAELEVRIQKRYCV